MLAKKKKIIIIKRRKEESREISGSRYSADS